MKVIGMAGDSWNPHYICTIEHHELSKFLGLYYNKMQALKVGEVVDLGKGYDHASEIASAMKATQDLIKAHQPVVTAILNGLRIQAISNEQPQPAPTAQS